MSDMGRGALLLASLLLVGCSDESEPAPVVPVEQPPEEACPPPNRMVGEACIEPGVQDNGCPAGTLGLDDGSCQPAGVPPELCAEGFVHDGDAACEPILPPDRCPPGQMAIPGDTACHPVMDCGSGRWGDIPVDGSTVYVDAAYTGGMSDGSEQQPYATISEAVTAAADGALIAIAAGTYSENVVVQKRLHLWGVCPELVEIVGSGLAALDFRPGSTSSEAHGLGLTGSQVGILATGATDIVIEHLWAHDVSLRGINVESTQGAASATVSNSLIEGSRQVGVYVSSANVTLDRVVVRSTQEAFGIAVEHDTGTPDAGTTAIERSVVEDNARHGVFVLGSQLSAQGLVVRGTMPDPQGDAGRGIDVTGVPDSVATATVVSSLIEANHEVGVYASGGELTLDGVVVRNTLPRQADGELGRGVQFQPTAVGALPVAATVSRSLIERNHSVGVVIASSQAMFEGVVVRDTHLTASSQAGGVGVEAVMFAESVPPAIAIVGSLVENNPGGGVSLRATADARLEGLLVRGAQAQGQQRGAGVGVTIQLQRETLTPATAIVVGSRIETSRAAGIHVGASDSTIVGTAVYDTAVSPADGLFGDGVTVISGFVSGTLMPATAAVSYTRIERSVRAGLSSFGAAVMLEATTLGCNAIQLAGEPFAQLPYSFDDGGRNGCGCPEPTGACTAETSGLAAPESLGGTTE